MKVSISFFAVTREAAGVDKAELDIPEGSTVNMLWKMLEKQFTGLEKYLPTTAAAVNDRYAKKDTILKDGDRVSLIPPVCGG